MTTPLNLPKEPLPQAPGTSIYLTGNKAGKAQTEEELRRSGWVFPNGTPPEMLQSAVKPAPTLISEKPTTKALDISKLTPEAIESLKAAGWVFPDPMPTK